MVLTTSSHILRVFFVIDYYVTQIYNKRLFEEFMSYLINVEFEKILHLFSFRVSSLANGG